jgi:uncharacterized protein DUF4956
MNKSTGRLLLVFITVLVASALLVYFILGRSTAVRTGADRATATANEDSTAQAQPTAPPRPNSGETIISELFGSDYASPPTPEDAGRGVVAFRIFLRFLIAALLATFLAFRWRRGVSITKRNPYVAQTQILLAVVAAAMMMVVGDSAARAFGIFAAASLVRFRTNIRDPKETTVLLICLGVGLASGVGRFDMAAILTLFVLVSLWILEHYESAQVFRTMEMSIGTRNLDQTLQVLKHLFSRHGFPSELRQLNREEGEGENGKIVYELSVGSTVNTDDLTEEILGEDAKNILSLEWDQKKSSTYIYR